MDVVIEEISLQFRKELLRFREPIFQNQSPIS
jgi:hypothetical protein